MDNVLDELQFEKRRLLLDKQVRPGERGSAEQKVATVNQTIFSFSNAVISKGIVSMPYIVMNLGIVWATVYNIILCTVVYLSSKLIIKETMVTQKFTLFDVVGQSLGASYGIIVQIFLAISLWSGLVSILIVVADVLSGAHGYDGILVMIFNYFDLDAHGTWYTSRNFVLFVVLLVCITPLTFKKNLKALVVPSQFAVFIATMLVVSVSVLAVRQIVYTKNVKLLLWPSISTVTDGSKFQVSLLFINAVSTISSCYTSSAHLPPLMAELKDCSYESMSKVVRVSTYITFSLNMIIAIASCFLFGTTVQPDVLINLVSFHNIGSIISLLYVAKVILIFPMINWPLRETIGRAILGNPWPTGFRFNLLTLLILVLTYLMTFIFKSLQDVLSFVGCTSGVVMISVIPALFITTHYWDQKGSKLFLVVFIVTGSLTLYGGLTNVICSILRESL